MSLRRSALASLGLSAIGIAIAWRRFLTGERSPFQTDIEFYHHPVTRELVRAWSEGRIPLWTDRVYLGFPFFADPQTAAWYPGTLLVTALGPHGGYVAFLLLHAWLAAVGGQALLRMHGASPAAALAAGLTIPLSGFFAYETQHPGLFAILCWVPAWLAATRRLYESPGPGRFALAALPLAFMVFAGTLQVLFGVALLYAGYLAALAFDTRTQRADRRVVRGLVLVVGSQLLGLSIAAVVLIPAFAHLPHTARALGMDYAFASIGSVHPVQLLGLVANRAETLLAGGRRIDFEGASFHLGALALPLALLGLAASSRALAAALGTTLALLLLLAAGRHAPLHPLLYEVLPGAVGSLRGMGRALGALVVGVALLVGLGLDAAPQPRWRRALVGMLGATSLLLLFVLFRSPLPPEPRALGSLAVVAAALALCLLCARRPQWLRPGLAALIVFDLLAFGAHDDRMERSPRPPDERRVDGRLRYPLLAELASDPDADGSRIALLGRLGGDNLTFHHGLDGLTGYNPLVTLQYLDFVHLVDAGSLRPRVPLSRYVHAEVPSRVEAGLFGAASVRFLISEAPLDAPDLRLVERSWNPLTRNTLLLYEQTNPLPRAYLATRTIRADSQEQLERLLGADFDPRRSTVFEGEARELDGPAGVAAVQETRLRPEQRVFLVETGAPALLVVTDSWYPGWVARVDGEEAPVLRVNGSFRGVPVDRGRHRVEMRFEPWTFRVGAGLSLAALAVTLALAARAFLARFRASPQI